MTCLVDTLPYLNFFSSIDMAGQFDEGQDKEEMYADGNDKHNTGSDDDQDDDSDDDKDDEDDTAIVPESQQLSLWLS